MGYSREIEQIALRQLSERRNRVRLEQDSRRKKVFAEYPELSECERAIARSAMEAARAVLHSDDLSADLSTLISENLSLQRHFSELLIRGGYPADYLDPHPICPACGDEGYVGGVMCECMRELMRLEAFRRLNEITPASTSDFERFSLDYYPVEPLSEGQPSPHRQMERILRYCQNYAEHFTPHSPSILMQGATGLGKTHLSLAIAGEVLSRGYGVIYGSVQNLVQRIEREHFGRSGERGQTITALIDCDLLILDDLGTEFTSTFVTSTMYNLINSRQLSGRPIIISTNLSLRELNEKYTERFVSRIIGGFERLVFYGRDVRQQRKFGQG